MRCYKINPDKLKDYGFKYNVYRIVGYQYKQKPIIFIDFIVTDSTLRYNVVKQNGDTYFPYKNVRKATPLGMGWIAKNIKIMCI